MSSLRATLLDLLAGDDALRVLLPGGVYDTPIARDGAHAKPDAFDMDRGGVLKPCAVLTMETATPSGPRAVRGEQAFFAVYFYARRCADIDAALKRVKDLLDDRAALDLEDDGFVYEIRHVEDSADFLEEELGRAPARFSRYSAVLHR